MIFADARKSIEISFDGLVEIFGTDDKLSIGARSGGDRAVEFDGRGQDKTIVVIGMLTDEIHTSRRTIEAGRSAKARAKLVQQWKRVFQHSVLFQIRLRRDGRICRRRSRGCCEVG